jgi:hypothetical protein
MAGFQGFHGFDMVSQAPSCGGTNGAPENGWNLCRTPPLEPVGLMEPLEPR